jgi:hypothetical protein
MTIRRLLPFETASPYRGKFRRADVARRIDQHDDTTPNAITILILINL